MHCPSSVHFPVWSRLWSGGGDQESHPSEPPRSHALNRRALPECRRWRARRPADSSWGPRRYQRGGHGEPRGMSCGWHPIATRRWWLNQLVPFPSMILPRDLHAWPCISSLRGPSRRRPPTWNPANAILCPLEAYLFMFASPIFFSSLTKRPRLDSLYAAWGLPNGRGTVGFQIRGCLVHSRLPETVSPPCWGRMQGVVKPAMAVDQDPMRAFYPGWAFFV